MKKHIEEKVEKKEQASSTNDDLLQREGETIMETAERTFPPDDPEVIKRIKSGDDLLDKAFNIALNKKFKKK